jgi:hypothetical protein
MQANRCVAGARTYDLSVPWMDDIRRIVLMGWCPAPLIVLSPSFRVRVVGRSTHVPAYRASFWSQGRIHRALAVAADPVGHPR